MANIVIPSPECAKNLPKSALGKTINLLREIERPSFENKSSMVPITIHAPKNTPTGPTKLFPVCIAQIRPAKQMERIKTKISFLKEFSIFALFHGRLDPIGKINPNKIMNGVNAALKNGGPTESFLSKNNSATKGHIVPKNTTKADTASSTLLETRAVSLLTTEKTPLASIALDLKLKSVSAPPIKIPNMININIPLSGSFAKA